MNMKYDIEDPQLSKKLSPKKVKTALGEVEYAEIGEGSPVVALHGAMGGYDQSLLLAQTVGCSGYRYIAVSRPGYLGTPMASGQTPEQQGDIIAALLDSLGIAQAGIIAISGGGPAAVCFGLRHSDRCSGLILISTCADKTDMRIPFLFNVMKFLARRPLFVRLFHRKAEKNLKAVAAHSVRDPEILNRTVNDPEAWPLFSALLLSTYDRMEKRLDGTENDIEITRTAAYPLEDLKPRVLIVHGTQDPLVDFESQAKIYEARVPNAKLLAVEGGEHVAIFTHRNLIRKEVSEFMKQHFSA
jgi:pimeloyl-ACP methyl ester carboxylesterase